MALAVYSLRHVTSMARYLDWFLHVKMLVHLQFMAQLDTGHTADQRMAHFSTTHGRYLRLC